MITVCTCDMLIHLSINKSLAARIGKLRRDENVYNPVCAIDLVVLERYVVTPSDILTTVITCDSDTLAKTLKITNLSLEDL